MRKLLLGALAGASLITSAFGLDLPLGSLPMTNSVSDTNTFVVISGPLGSTNRPVRQITYSNLVEALRLRISAGGGITNGQTNLTLGGTFSGVMNGNGNNLTNLAGASVIGTLPLSTLPSSVLTNNRPSSSPVTFGGPVNGGIFIGSGAGLVGLQGQQLQSASVNFNSFDAPTLALLGGGTNGVAVVAGAGLTNNVTSSGGKLTNTLYANPSDPIFSGLGGGGNNPAYGLLVGFVFRESRLGFPGPGAEEALHPVYSSDYGKSWVGGTGYPVITDPLGIRDPALLEVGNIEAVSYTQASENNLHSTNFPIWSVNTSNLSAQAWTKATNISLAMPGETAVFSNWYQWSPVLVIDGASVYLFGSVSTNNNVSFEIRYVTGTTNGFPFDFGATRRMSDSLTAGITNIIDLTPFFRPAYGWMAWYKNESTTAVDSGRGKRVQLGRFVNGLTNAFTTALEGDIGNGGQFWPVGFEGNWSVQLPNGNERVFAIKYQQQDYVYQGDGRIMSFAEANVLTNSGTSNGWQPVTNSTVPFYLQSFKPMLVTTPSKIVAWKSLVDGAGYARGELIVQPEIGASGSTEGKTLFGYAYTAPFPQPYDTSQATSTNGAGRFTNDYAQISLAAGGQGGGMFGDSLDNSLNFWVWSGVADSRSENVPRHPDNAKRAVKVSTNWLSLATGINLRSLGSNALGAVSATSLSVGGVPITGGGSVPANILTNDFVGQIRLTNTPSALNSPSIELRTTTDPAGSQAGAFTIMRNMNYPNGWFLGQINISNMFTIQQSDTPFTHFMEFLTNGTVNVPGNLTIAGVPVTAGGGSVPANILTNDFVGQIRMTNTPGSLNSPSLEMRTSVDPAGGAAGAFLIMRNMGYSNGWLMGQINISNQFTIQQSDTPFTHFMEFQTNGNVRVPGTLQVSGTATAGTVSATTFSGPAAGLTGVITNNYNGPFSLGPSGYLNGINTAMLVYMSSGASTLQQVRADSSTAWLTNCTWVMGTSGGITNYFGPDYVSIATSLTNRGNVIFPGTNFVYAPNSLFTSSNLYPLGKIYGCNGPGQGAGGGVYVDLNSGCAATVGVFGAFYTYDSTGLSVGNSGVTKVKLLATTGEIKQSGTSSLQTNFFNGVLNGFTGIVSPTNGVSSVASNALVPLSITFPASTANWTNTTGRNIYVFIDNAAVTGTSVKVNGATIFSGLSTDVTLPLQNGEWFSETYTVGTPTATIKPF